jgi:hypothetical protein
MPPFDAQLDDLALVAQVDLAIHIQLVSLPP